MLVVPTPPATVTGFGLSVRGLAALVVSDALATSPANNRSEPVAPCGVNGTTNGISCTLLATIGPALAEDEADGLGVGLLAGGCDNDPRDKVLRGAFP